MNGLKSSAAIVAPAVMAATLAVLGLVGTVPAHAQADALIGICDFPISHEFPKLHGNRGHELPPPAPYEGFDTGQVGVVITNLDTGESVEAFANSAAFGVDEHSGFFRGQSIAFVDSPRGDVPKGVWVVNGDLRVTFDDAGRLATVSGGVLRRDICAELA